jgi:hypothetical protein
MTNGHGEKLTRTQDQAVAALLLHPTLATAAKAVGVGEKTLWRWLRDEGFSAAYREARREAVAQAIARLQQVATEAVDALRGVRSDTAAPAPARVSAAKVMREMAVKAVEVEDLEQRLRQLEANEY